MVPQPIQLNLQVWARKLIRFCKSTLEFNNLDYKSITLWSIFVIFFSFICWFFIIFLSYYLWVSFSYFISLYMNFSFYIVIKLFQLILDCYYLYFYLPTCYLYVIVKLSCLYILKCSVQMLMFVWQEGLGVTLLRRVGILEQFLIR